MSSENPSPIWRTWQLIDSAFPMGGFAHSAGLEATLQQGEVDGPAAFARFLEASLWQAGYGALPLVNAAFDDPRLLGELDRRADVFLSNPITNRASRVQGRTFLATCARVFEGPVIAELGVGLKRDGGAFHFAPLFGVVLKTLGLRRDEVQGVFLHLNLRGVVSAAVRLGIVGPYEAQRVQDRAGSLLDHVRETCAHLGERDLAQTAPLVDLFQGNHDRLYSRLFQS